MPANGNPYADTRDMYTVHTVFRREFALLPTLVRGVAAKDAERAEVIAAHIRLVNEILFHHHESEDAVLWPALLQRAPREIDPVVHLLEGQHENLDTVIGEVNAALDGWVGAAEAGGREELAALLQKLAANVYEHMGLEEKLVLPLVERHVFATEWQAMVAAGAAAIPTEVGPVLVGMLMYEGGLEVVPPEMREVLAELAPKAYAAHCELVHGTPTPPRSGEVGLGTPYVGVIGS
jgi:iron-sulfur cluster repair protein YtfE (RIC family)